MSPKAASTATPRTPTRRSPRRRGGTNVSSRRIQPQRLELDTAVQHTPPSTLTRSTNTNDTNTNDAQLTPRSRRINDRSNLSLFQLANVPSPLQQRDHNTEEEEYDRRCYEENAGAADSEDEPDVEDVVDSEDKFHPSSEDRHMSKEDKEVVGLNAFVDVKIEPGADAEPWCFGAPVGWKPPTAPEDWKPSKKKRDEPEFNELDNPGGWSEFNYRAKCNTRGKYLRHQLPTGVTPVPINEETGKRECEGWTFFYQGWKKENDDLVRRDGSNKNNTFPKHRRGSLDQNKLALIGLNEGRMKNLDGDPDALFFYNMLLPIHQINKEKGIEPVKDDPRKPFYAPVAKYTNLYAVGELELGSGYGHRCEPTNPAELVQWDGVLVTDGVRGGSKGAILRRFDNYPGSKSYDPDIARAFTKTRWLEIKRCIKLCNNLTAPKKKEEGYNPAYKYDMIFDTIVHNVNALTLCANPDLCGDETSCGHQGFGEPGTHLVYNVKGKPNITKGMQTVMLSDVDWLRPRAYLHRHNQHPQLFSAQGCNEVRLLWETQILPLCQHDNPIIGRALFNTKPHMTWDNFFSGDDIMEYAAEQGFGLTMTCRRDRLPKNVPREYFHHKKVLVNKRTRSARFEQPIVAVKKINQSVLTVTSFQSTSSCNIASVNALNEVELYAFTKERGRGEKKRRWAIEMNEARSLYLNSYGVIDRIDHLIKNCNLHYRSWKYWHSAMIHAKGMAIVVACDMYLECCTGLLNPNWKCTPVSFYRFREVLGKQMLAYSPTDRKYPGDESMRVCTKQSKKNRTPSSIMSIDSSRTTSSLSSTATPNGITKEKLDLTGNRLCGFLDDLLEHEKAIVGLKNKAHQVCHCCGKPACHYCSLCPDKPALHVTHRDGKNSCFLHYHNTSSFGTWKEDFKWAGHKRKDWTFPDAPRLQESSRQMKRLHQSICQQASTSTSTVDQIRADATWNGHTI